MCAATVLLLSRKFGAFCTRACAIIPQTAVKLSPVDLDGPAGNDPSGGVSHVGCEQAITTAAEAHMLVLQDHSLQKTAGSVSICQSPRRVHVAAGHVR